MPTGTPYCTPSSAPVPSTGAGKSSVGSAVAEGAEVEQHAVRGIRRQLLLVHLDDVGGVARGHGRRELVPVAGPVGVLRLDRDVLVLGLEGRDELLGDLVADVVAPPGEAERDGLVGQRGRGARGLCRGCLRARGQRQRRRCADGGEQQPAVCGSGASHVLHPFDRSRVVVCGACDEGGPGGPAKWCCDESSVT